MAGEPGVAARQARRAADESPVLPPGRGHGQQPLGDRDLAERRLGAHRHQPATSRSGAGSPRARRYGLAAAGRIVRTM